MALDLASPNELNALFSPTAARYASSTVSRSPIVFGKRSDQPLLIKKRQSRARSNSVFPVSNNLLSANLSNRRAVSFELDSVPLSHKVSFYDLNKYDCMESDSSTSSSSVFSDHEEDNDSDDDSVFPKFYTNLKATSLQFPTSCTFAIDSYFTMPNNNLPTKQTPRKPLKSLSSKSLFLNEYPQLSPDLSAVKSYDYPPCSTGFSWGMPSFGCPSTRYFPRHCKVRRTLSMFEHSEKILLSSRDNVSSSSVQAPTFFPLSGKPSILSMENCPIKTHIVSQDQFKRIDSKTLCEIMDGRHAGLYDRYVVVDCRFDYEYNGGHIDGAINVNSKQCLYEKLISTASITERVLLIFHCEYSAHRGPRLAMQLRTLDREANMNRYPMLYYPDITILSGGYSSFFKSYTNRCFPQMYVGMNDNSHVETCEREMEKFRRNMKISRTQTFTNTASLAQHSSSTLSVFPKSKSTINPSFQFPLERTNFLERKHENDLSSPICIKTNTLFDDSTPTTNKRRLGGYSKLSAPAAGACF